MLLLATPLAFESSIGVQNETASAQAAETKEQNERIEIVVMSDEIVRVNREDVPRSQLAATLTPMLSASVDRTVMVGCETGVTHGAFVDVLDQAKLSGAVEIAVFER
jgi:biopolymer transport protein ExbD